MSDFRSMDGEFDPRLVPYFCEDSDHEIFSMVILVLQLIEDGLLSVTHESMCMKYWLTA